MDRLTTDSRGPLRLFLASLPHWKGSVEGAANAAVLNHSVVVLGPERLPTTLGNQLHPLPQPVIVEFSLVFIVTVNGFPLWAMSVPESRHPPTTASSTAFWFR